ncbi:MAG: DUF4160 domain-containing protein, partial [Bacteroidota bacterium]
MGLVIFFYSNEHYPVHVHARYQGHESKAEFIIVDGDIKEIRIKSVQGYPPLTGTAVRNFESFLEQYAQNVVEKWIDYFVYHKEIVFE